MSCSQFLKLVLASITLIFETCSRNSALTCLWAISMHGIRGRKALGLNLHHLVNVTEPLFFLYHFFVIFCREHDTVGCVALDRHGHVACATSTGGITAKLPGRVGDTPLVGCGGIADDEIGAVSTTGHGEAITKSCLAKTVLNYMSTGIH